MTDADLIYNACLRTERAFEAEVERRQAFAWWRKFAPGYDAQMCALVGALAAVMGLRESVGNIMAEERR